MSVENHDLPFVTRESAIAGRGNFATKFLPAGQTVAIMTGEVMDGGELQARVEADQLSWDDDLQIELNRYMILDQPWMSINHSCNPNSGIKGETTLFSTKGIQTGDEITYDYSTVVGSHSTWTMICNCGSGNCRKVIGSVLTIPKSQLHYYIEIGALPDFILEELSNPGQ